MGMLCDKESVQRFQDAADRDRYEIFDMPRQLRQAYVWLPPNGMSKRTHRDDQARCTGIFNLRITKKDEPAEGEAQEPEQEQQE